MLGLVLGWSYQHLAAINWFWFWLWGLVFRQKYTTVFSTAFVSGLVFDLVCLSRLGLSSLVFLLFCLFIMGLRHLTHQGNDWLPVAMIPAADIIWQKIVFGRTDITLSLALGIAGLILTYWWIRNNPADDQHGIFLS